MKRELRDNILEELAAMEGRVGFYFKNLVTGENLGYNQRAVSYTHLDVYKRQGCKRSFSQEYLISASAGRTDQDRKGKTRYEDN